MTFGRSFKGPWLIIQNLLITTAAAAIDVPLVDPRGRIPATDKPVIVRIVDPAARADGIRSPVDGAESPEVPGAVTTEAPTIGATGRITAVIGRTTVAVGQMTVATGPTTAGTGLRIAVIGRTRLPGVQIAAETTELVSGAADAGSAGPIVRLAPAVQAAPVASVAGRAVLIGARVAIADRPAAGDLREIAELAAVTDTAVVRAVGPAPAKVVRTAVVRIAVGRTGRGRIGPRQTAVRQTAVRQTGADQTAGARAMAGPSTAGLVGNVRVRTDPIGVALTVAGRVRIGLSTAGSGMTAGSDQVAGTLTGRLAGAVEATTPAAARAALMDVTTVRTDVMTIPKDGPRLAGAHLTAQIVQVLTDRRAIGPTLAETVAVVQAIVEPDPVVRVRIRDGRVTARIVPGVTAKSGRDDTASSGPGVLSTSGPGTGRSGPSVIGRTGLGARVLGRTDRGDRIVATIGRVPGTAGRGRSGRPARATRGRPVAKTGSPTRRCPMILIPASSTRTYGRRYAVSQRR